MQLTNKVILHVIVHSTGKHTIIVETTNINENIMTLEINQPYHLWFIWNLYGRIILDSKYKNTTKIRSETTLQIIIGN